MAEEEENFQRIKRKLQKQFEQHQKSYIQWNQPSSFSQAQSLKRQLNQLIFFNMKKEKTLSSLQSKADQLLLQTTQERKKSSKRILRQEISKIQKKHAQQIQETYQLNFMSQKIKKQIGRLAKSLQELKKNSKTYTRYLQKAVNVKREASLQLKTTGGRLLRSQQSIRSHHKFRTNKLNIRKKFADQLKKQTEIATSNIIKSIQWQESQQQKTSFLLYNLQKAVHINDLKKRDLDSQSSFISSFESSFQTLYKQFLHRLLPEQSVPSIEEVIFQYWQKISYNSSLQSWITELTLQETFLKRQISKLKTELKYAEQHTLSSEYVRSIKEKVGSLFPNSKPTLNLLEEEVKFAYKIQPQKPESIIIEFLKELENLIERLKQILMGVVKTGLEPPVGILKFIGTGFPGGVTRKSSMSAMNQQRINRNMTDLRSQAGTPMSMENQFNFPLLQNEVFTQRDIKQSFLDFYPFAESHSVIFIQNIKKYPILHRYLSGALLNCYLVEVSSSYLNKQPDNAIQQIYKLNQLIFDQISSNINKKINLLKNIMITISKGNENMKNTVHDMYFIPKPKRKVATKSFLLWEKFFHTQIPVQVVSANKFLIAIGSLQNQIYQKQQKRKFVQEKGNLDSTKERRLTFKGVVPNKKMNKLIVKSPAGAELKQFNFHSELKSTQSSLSRLSQYSKKHN